MIGGLTHTTAFGLTTAQVTSTFVNRGGVSGAIPRPNPISLSDAAKALAAIDKAIEAGKPLSIPQALLLQQYDQLEDSDGDKKVFSITDTSANLLANLEDLQTLLDDGNLSGVNLTDRATLAVTPAVFLDGIQLFDAIQTDYTLNVTEPFPAADIQYADRDVLTRFTKLEVVGSTDEILDARNILADLPDSVARNWLVIDTPENIETRFDDLAALKGLQKIAMITDPDTPVAIPGFQNGALNVGLLRLTQAQYTAGKDVLTAIQPKPPATTANYLVALRDCKADSAAGMRRDNRVVSIAFTDTAANVARNAPALNALTTFSQISIVDTAANIAAQAKAINTLRKPFEVYVAGSGSDKAPTVSAAVFGDPESGQAIVSGVARIAGASYVAQYNANADEWTVSSPDLPNQTATGADALTFNGLKFTFSGKPEDGHELEITPKTGLLLVSGVARTAGASYVARYDATAGAWTVTSPEHPALTATGVQTLTLDGLKFTFSGEPDDGEELLISPGENIGSVLANAPLLKTLRAGVPVVGSSADILANAGKLAQMGNVSAITLTDRSDAPLEISYTQYIEGRAALARIAPPAKLKVLDATLENVTNVIRDPLVEAVAIADDVLALGNDKAIAFLNKVSDIASPLYLNTTRAAPLRIESLTARVTSVGDAANAAIANLTALNVPAEGALREVDQSSIGSGPSFTPGVYKNVPLLETGNGAGAGATANVTVNADGEVVSVEIVNRGAAYSGDRLTLDPRLLGGSHSVALANNPDLDDPTKLGFVGDDTQFFIEIETTDVSVAGAPKRPILTFACEDILTPDPPSPTNLPQTLSESAQATLTAIQLVAKRTQREDGTTYDPKITLKIIDAAERLAIAATTPATQTFDFTDLLTVYQGANGGTLANNLTVEYVAKDGFTAVSANSDDLDLLPSYSVIGTAAQLAQAIESSAAANWTTPDWTKIDEIILADRPPQPVIVSKTLLADEDDVEALDENILQKSSGLRLAVREAVDFDEASDIQDLSINDRIARIALVTDATELSDQETFGTIKEWTNLASVQLTTTRLQKPNLVIDASLHPDYDTLVRKIAQSFTISLSNVTATDALGPAFRDARVTKVSVRDDWSALSPAEKPGVLANLAKAFAAGRISGVAISGGFDEETDPDTGDTIQSVSMRGADIIAFDAARNRLRDSFLSQITALDDDGEPMELIIKPTKVKVSEHKAIVTLSTSLPDHSFKAYELRDTAANISAYLSQPSIPQAAQDLISSIAASDSDVARVVLAYARIAAYPDLIERLQSGLRATEVPVAQIASLLDDYASKLDRITLAVNTTRTLLPDDAITALSTYSFGTRLFSKNGRLVT